MNYNRNRLIHKTILFFSFLILTGLNAQEINREIDFNLDWKFHLSLDEKTFESIKTNTSEWKSVQLPHDWVVEKEFDSLLGLDAHATGYLPGNGYGFYQKTFDLDVDKNSNVHILFDGVYNNSEVWINGHLLGFHPYGYSPFYYDLTPYLNTNGKNNNIQVKIDHSRYADSRWYTGAGIYRNVKLITSHKLHIPIWGTFITTPEVTKENSIVNLEIQIKNEFNTPKKFKLESSIYNPKNELVKKIESSLALDPNSNVTTNQQVQIENPSLWDIDQPNLYKVETKIIIDNSIVDSYTSSFGIRSIEFDSDKGFFLNGTSMKIKGVCLHHDGGLVGSAVPKGVWKRRLQILKDGGCNAIRISHNPGSDEFLTLCDEMGILVQDELFDEWDYPKDKRYNQKEKSIDYITRGYGEHFQTWGEKDAKAVVRSHRNHPSIFQWSIGNEIEWTYPRNADATGFFNNMNWSGNYFWEEPPHSPEEIKHQLEILPKAEYDIGVTANKISGWVKSLDTTRFVTANCILPSASHLSGYADALDVIGYSYRRVLYDYGHNNYPEKPIMGLENLGQYHEWKAIMERPFIAGTYLWTGIDYMGEIRAEWPTRVQPSGLLNTAGFAKGSYFMMKSLWTEKPMMHMATQTLENTKYIMAANGSLATEDPEAWEHALWEWQDVNEHWNYQKGDNMVIEIYSNCDEIELFLNEKSLGKKVLKDFEDHIYKWGIPFEEGKLIAKGKKNGQEIVSEIVTARKAKQIRLSSDNKTLKANNYDVSHIIVQLVDEKGNPVKTDDQEITFEIKGSAKLLGVDNGWKKSVQKFQTNVNTTHEGRTLLIIQSMDEADKVEVIAKAKDFENESIYITIK